MSLLYTDPVGYGAGGAITQKVRAGQSKYLKVIAMLRAQGHDKPVVAYRQLKAQYGDLDGVIAHMGGGRKRGRGGISIGGARARGRKGKGKGIVGAVLGSLSHLLPF